MHGCAPAHPHTDGSGAWASWLGRQLQNLNIKTEKQKKEVLRSTIVVKNGEEPVSLWTSPLRWTKAEAECLESEAGASRP